MPPHSGLSRNWARLTGTGRWSRLTNGSSGMWQHSAMYQRRKARTVPFSCSIQTEDYSHGLPFTCQWLRWKKDFARLAVYQPARNDLLHAGIAFTFQGRDNPGSAACCWCITISLWWLAADMCDRRRIQDQAIPNSPSAPPDKSGEWKKGSVASRWWRLQFCTRYIRGDHVHH